MNEVTTKAYHRRSAGQWQALIEEQTSSGQSQRAFCETHSISLSSFYAAKQRLGTTSDEVEDTDFVPVDLGFDRASGWQVEVALGETVTLRFTRA